MVAYAFEVKSAEKDAVRLVGQFADDVSQRLNLFLSQCDDLAQSKPFQNGFPIHISIKGRTGEPMQFKADLPSRDDLSILLHRLRPLILDREPASFVRVHSLLGKEIADDDFRALLKQQRLLYDGRDFQQQIRIAADDQILNSESVLQDWLNSYEYHRDEDRKKAIDRLLALVPSDLLHGLMFSLIADKVNAIGGIRQIIATILGLNRGARFRDHLVLSSQG
jgi:hypothetical protein